MDDFDISFDHVIRHYDVTGKICPNPYVKNNGYKTSWTWTQFKNNLKQYRKDGTITNPNKSSSSTVPIE
jgi:N-acetylmuramoyl-L-alanine amidase CwlA